MTYQKSHIFPRKTLGLYIIAVTVMMFSLCVPSLSAGETPAETSGWEFQVAPYMWFMSASGDVTVKGQESDVDMSFSDILDQLNIGAMAAFDARRGRWGFFGDMIAANLGTETKVGGIKIDPTAKLGWLTGGGFYRLGTWNLSEAPGKRVKTLTLDALAGARYTYVDVNLNIKGFQDRSANKSWVDPLIGARASLDLSRRWVVSLNGNIGGFGVGSDFAWSAAGSLGYRFSLFGEDDARVIGGYRALGQDYSDGSGNNKFKWDMTFYGPILGLSVRF